LVEFLIAAVVIAIMAAVVLPNVSSAARQNLSSATQAIAGDLMLARSAAVQYNTEWSIQFDLAGNLYTISQTGPGAAPALQNPISGGAPGSPYQVNIGGIGVPAGRGNGVKLAAAFLANSKQPVTDLRFQSLGGTGPSRSEDTAIWLTQGRGAETQYVRLTVSWITGQVFVDSPTSTPPQ
jgi:type II secretory pathway pseudopilin PulG